MQEEQSARRSAVYSMWHRIGSLCPRYIDNPDRAKALGCIDLDQVIWVEWHMERKEPLALIETARKSDKFKATSILHRLAFRAGLPAYCVRYDESKRHNPDPSIEKRFGIRVPDIDRFYLREVAPNLCSRELEYTPVEYANWLAGQRDHWLRRFARDLKGNGALEPGMEYCAMCLRRIESAHLLEIQNGHETP